MSTVIRISSSTYNRLAKFAEGFDTPANVIERMLDHVENCEKSIPAHKRESTATDDKTVAVSDGVFNKRDTTKYVFNGLELGKAKLVLAVVRDYVLDHPDTSYEELETIFPKVLQGSLGVFDDVENAQEIVERSGHKRHYLKPNEVIQLSDRKVAVCTQWGIGNIDKFIEQAGSLGYEITKIDSR